MSYSDPTELQVEFEDMVIVETEVPVGGTSDHSQLANRDAANQHPISAISGLQDALDGKQSAGDYVIGSMLESLVEDAGFTKNTGTYSKPTDGIPKADLASDVQESLGKADTALQEHQSLADYATKLQVSNMQAGLFIMLKGYREVADSYSKTETDALLASAGKVKTVNNVEPDENGNIDIEAGISGTTFTPSVSSDGTLSWTNDGGKDNPAPVNIKGDTGATGAQGAQGEKGDKGDKGDTPVKGTDYWTAADKTEIVDDVLAALPTWTGGSY